MRAIVLALMLLPAAAGPAWAATLRPMTTLRAGVVRLSDLFDDAGPRAGMALGPGPAPGGRIVVEAPQLAAIARDYGVDWRPGSLADRAVLDRPGRPLEREAVLAALRAALAGTAAGPECDIDIAGFSPPLVPTDARVVPVVSQVEYDAASGRFGAMLSVTAAEMEPLDLRLAGRAEPVALLPVAAARLVAGTVVGAADLRMERVHARALHAEMAASPEQAVGLELRHQVMPGQPLPLADLGPPTLVARGAAVLVVLDSPGIALTAEGTAMEAGGLGARIRVLNPASRAVVQADVIGPGRVRVAPDSVPVVPPAARGQNTAQVLR